MCAMGMYVHIPFCSKKCDYCDFTSFCLGKNEQEQYLNALIREIDLKKQSMANMQFDTLYIGGGTPSVVYPGFISALAKKIFSSFNFCKNFEFTIEVNPNSFSQQKLDEYLLIGCNRISLGVQSLTKKVLNKVGRNQTKKQVKNAFKILKNNNFTNISADVIIGLPCQTLHSVKSTLKYLIKRTKHISVYALQVEDNTPLKQNIQNKLLTPKTDEQTLKYYNSVCAILQKHGFNRYEISNFARQGYQSKHNQKYWQGVEYVGLGLNSHSFIDGVRFYNTKNLNEYITKLTQNKLPIEYTEKLTQEEERTERIMLSLRTSDGLNLAKFKQDFNEDLTITKAQQIKKLQALNLITIKNGFLKITSQNFYLANSIILELA